MPSSARCSATPVGSSHGRSPRTTSVCGWRSYRSDTPARDARWCSVRAGPCRPSWLQWRCSAYGSVNTTRVCRSRAPTVSSSRYAATLAAVRASGRNPVLWVLLAVVPAVFVVFAQLTTPHSPTSVTVTDAGVTGPRTFDVFDIHAGTMTPIAVASLAALAGVFALADSRAGDARLVVAGMRPTAALAARVAVLMAAATLAAGVTLAVSAPFFHAAQWAWFAMSVLLIALTYALLGALVAPLVGRVAAVLLAFLVPFLDLGIGQSPMLASQPAGWAHWLPSYPAYRLLIDSGLSQRFDSTSEVLMAAGWILVLAAVLTVVSRAGFATVARHARPVSLETARD